MEDIDTKTEVDKLFNNIKSGKKVYDTFASQHRKQYMINGATIDQWEDKFKVQIPPDLDSAACRSIDNKLLELHQEATFHKSAASAVLQALRKGSETEYRSKFTNLVNEYKDKGLKLPAATTLQTMAMANLDDVNAAVVAAEVAYEFWANVIKHLDYSRKLVENITINLGIEAKLNPNQV